MNNQQFIGKVFGHFRILEPAGHGGMGLVFKALNTHLDKIVALKMIAPGLSLNEKLLNRFKTEARALARLENPHIVRISDLLEADNHWFIVMEYIEGDTLRDRLKDKRPLPLKEAIEITEQILSALQHAHSASIVHRDIKPSNILLTKDNVVKVTDFGLAKIQENSLIHTQVSAVGGTLYYMSPEQVRSLKETDHRTDIYSLGITMYQMVTGTVPFNPNQTDFDIRETIVRKPLPKPSTFNPYLPPEIDDFIMKAIEKNPDDRFQSAVEMSQELSELKEKIKDRLNQAQPDSGLAQDEPDFSNYLEIKEEFTEASVTPEIPIDKKITSEAEKEESKPEIRRSVTTTESTQFTRLTDIVKKKRFWLFGLLPVLIIILVLYLISLPRTPAASKTGTPIVKKSQLSVYTRPTEAQVLINNQLIGKSPIDSFILNEPQFTLKIVKTGFQPFDSTISLQKGQHLLLNVSLLPQPKSKPTTSAGSGPKTPSSRAVAKPMVTRLALTSNPAGAAVFINNNFIGQTPLKYNLNAGEKIRLRLEKSGYQKLQKQISVPTKETWQLNISLNPLPARLRITANQWPVQVQIDGQKKVIVNKNNNTLSVDPGKHIFVFRTPNFKAIQKELTLKKAESRSLTLSFTPLYGTLELHVLPWANILIDGQLVKKETNIKNRFKLTAGRHTLRIENPAFSFIKKTIEIKPDEVVQLKYNFNQKVETRILAFDTQNHPVFAQIFIDGTATGQYTPKAVYLTPGFHEISIKASGYQSQKQEVIVLPENNKPVRFVLQRLTNSGK